MNTVPNNTQSIRSYIDQKNDEDIKWQWAVRDSPCHLCHHHNKKRSWLSRMLGRNDKYELTNRHKEIKPNQPKFWEIEYYNYLLPNDYIKTLKAKTRGIKQSEKCKTADVSSNEECEGKRYPIIFTEYDNPETCIEKFQFDIKEPISLSKVCGQGRPPRKKLDEKTAFLCLNDLLQNKDKFDGPSPKKENTCSC